MTDWPGVTILSASFSVNVTARLGAEATVRVLADTGTGLLPPSVAAPASALSVMVLPPVALALTTTWKVTTQGVPTTILSPVILTLLELLFV
jgi:hypothetical protein